MSSTLTVVNTTTNGKEAIGEDLQLSMSLGRGLDSTGSQQLLENVAKFGLSKLISDYSRF